MPHTLVALLLFTVRAAALAPPQFELNTLAAYPTALCLDGSPGAYYSYHQENVDSWLIYIEGGAWCFTAESCASRAKTQLGSSITYPKNFSRDRGHATTQSCSAASPVATAP